MEEHTEISESSVEQTINLSPETESINNQKKSKKNKNKKTQDTSKKPKKPWYKRIIPFSIVMVVGVISGAVLGYWFYTNSKVDDSIYDTFVVSELVDSTQDVIASVLEVPSVSDEEMEVWLQTLRLKKPDANPSQYNPSVNINLALYNLSIAKTFEATGYGNVDTLIQQPIYSAKKFDGTTYTFESISSSSMASVAELAVMDKNDPSKILVMGGAVKAQDQADWNGTPKTMTDSEYIDTYGGLPNNPIPYIISSKTIKNNTPSIIEKSMEAETGKEIYTFTVELDNIKSVINYARQMKMLSGLSSRPLFSSCQITFTIDEDWNMVAYSVQEEYVAHMGPIKPACKGTLEIQFKINGEVILPEYSK